MRQLRVSAIRRIVHRIVAKRDVSDNSIKEVFGKRRVFEPFRMDGRIRIEIGGDAGGNRVKLNTCASRAGVQTFRHETKEVPDAHRRFENLCASL